MDAKYGDAVPHQNPPAELAQPLLCKQAGALADDAVGIAWEQVSITKIVERVAWAIDGVPIATDGQALGAFTTEGNIFIGYYDALSYTHLTLPTFLRLFTSIRPLQPKNPIQYLIYPAALPHHTLPQ